jgi:hypothetical protein
VTIEESVAGIELCMIFMAVLRNPCTPIPLQILQGTRRKIPSLTPRPLLSIQPGPASLHSISWHHMPNIFCPGLSIHIILTHVKEVHGCI